MTILIYDLPVLKNAQTTILINVLLKKMFQEKQNYICLSVYTYLVWWPLRCN